MTIKSDSSEEFEPLRETLATLRAEGSVSLSPLGDHQFTSKGYARYSEKIKALRVLS